MDELWNEFNDVLTDKQCGRVVVELIKYFLYYKEVVPYHYNLLKSLVTCERSTQPILDQNLRRKVELQLKKTIETFTTLNTIFDNIQEEMENSLKGEVKEIVLIFGGTPYTPKQIYSIQVPASLHDHLDIHHGDGDHLGDMLQALLDSVPLSIYLKRSIQPTNMYVFIKKEVEMSGSSNGWFVLKDKFKLPNIKQHFKIVLSNPDDDKIICDCKIPLNTSDYGDDFIRHHGLESFGQKPAFASLRSVDMNMSGMQVLPVDNVEIVKAERITQWYQAPVFVKTLTDVKVNGSSISNLWIAPRQERECNEFL